MHHSPFRASLIAAVGFCLLCLACRSVPLGGRLLVRRGDLPVSLAQARMRVAYNLRRGTFRVTRLRNSIELARMTTSLTVGGRTFASTDESCKNTMAHRDPLRMIIRSAVKDRPAWETRFEIRSHPNEGNAILDRALRDSYGVAVRFRVVGEETSGRPVRFVLAGEALAPRTAFACRLAPTTGATPLQIASGEAVSGLNSSFYDPEKDCAVHLGAQTVSIGGSQPHRLGRRFAIRLDVATDAGLDFVERFYETVHGFPYFPQSKRDRRLRPLAGWLDWYLTYGRTTEEELLRQVDWLADHLRDYGLEVIQIDDGWQAHHAERLEGHLGKKPTDWLRANTNFPHGMAWLADRIHEKGFQAGLWLVPYATNNAALVRERPEWFLRHSSGTLALAHGDWARQFGYILDLSHPQVRRRYLVPLFKTLSSRWGFDYFKLDATGWTLRGLDGDVFGKEKRSGAEIVREGLATIHREVGDRFVLACHAPCPAVVGLVDGARVAGDMSPGWERGPLHLLDQTLKQFFTHRICWLNDPDCLVIRPPLTVDQARAFASMFGLSGQHLMLSDPVDVLDRERLEILRRVLPVCPTRPLDLFARPDKAAIWDLKIERSFGSWDVVGLFNFENRPVRFVVRFGDLGLDPEGFYITYDYWNRRCLGRARGELVLDLAPTSCRVIAIHREAGRPQLISTSRHITQGGVDLVALAWNARRNEIAGRSLLVGNDPCELRFWLPEGYRPLGVETSTRDGTIEEADGGRLAVLRMVSRETGEMRWRVRFGRKGPAVSGNATF